MLHLRQCQRPRRNDNCNLSHGLGSMHSFLQVISSPTTLRFRGVVGGFWRGSGTCWLVATTLRSAFGQNRKRAVGRLEPRQTNKFQNFGNPGFYFSLHSLKAYVHARVPRDHFVGDSAPFPGRCRRLPACAAGLVLPPVKPGQTQSNHFSGCHRQPQHPFPMKTPHHRAAPDYNLDAPAPLAAGGGAPIAAPARTNARPTSRAGGRRFPDSRTHRAGPALGHQGESGQIKPSRFLRPSFLPINLVSEGGVPRRPLLPRRVGLVGLVPPSGSS